jgi:hypothetical protein
LLIYKDYKLKEGRSVAWCVKKCSCKTAQRKPEKIKQTLWFSLFLS